MKTLLAALLFVFSTSAMAQPPAVGGDGYQAWVVVNDEIYWCHWNHAYDALRDAIDRSFLFAKKQRYSNTPATDCSKKIPDLKGP